MNILRFYTFKTMTLIIFFQIKNTFLVAGEVFGGSREGKIRGAFRYGRVWKSGVEVGF